MSRAEKNMQFPQKEAIFVEKIVENAGSSCKKNGRIVTCRLFKVTN